MLQKKAFEAQEKQRAHVQTFIDRFRYNAKRASLVQSRIKVCLVTFVLDMMYNFEDVGLVF